MRFPGGSDSKRFACYVGDPGSIPGSERSPGEGNGSPLQYSCLENPMDGGAWQATVYGVGKIPSGGGNGYPLQYPCLDNLMDGGAWQATVYGVSKSWT